LRRTLVLLNYMAAERTKYLKIGHESNSNLLNYVKHTLPEIYQVN
jgi:hypothetical protein